MTVKLQSLSRDFETLMMKKDESIADFLSRTMAVVSQMRSYGEQISDETVVAKVMSSLTPKFDHVVAAIEEANDLSVLSVDELMRLLQSHEARLNRSVEKVEEKAFQVKESTTKQGESDRLASRGRGRGGFRGQGRGRDRGRGRNGGQRQYNEQSYPKNGFQCHHCKKYGHIKADCWYKDQKMNFATETEEENKLFMACIEADQKPSDLWFLDSGCSNHMTGT